MTDPIPTVREELERKVIDEVVRLADKVTKHRLDPADYSLVAKALWNVASGLIDEQTLAMVAHEAQLVPARTNKRHFFKDGSVITHIWKHETPGFLQITRKPDGSHKSAGIKGEPDERNQKLETLREHLLKTGWTEL